MFVSWVRKKFRRWLRARRIHRYDDFVESVIYQREQTDDPVRKSPTKVRFDRATRFVPTSETIYDPREVAMKFAATALPKKPWFK
ncbi:unnamed protein product [Clonostachys rosea]|uniref:Uncharacterized protein n=1 Tax=Bionectria ochroleuca TaxID=29856 RepID=A0ABY6UXU0_BIOOC|nr:unnamed protein product [Clonostachys rosea]